MQKAWKGLSRVGAVLFAVLFDVFPKLPSGSRWGLFPTILSVAFFFFALNGGLPMITAWWQYLLYILGGLLVIYNIYLAIRWIRIDIQINKQKQKTLNENTDLTQVLKQIQDNNEKMIQILQTNNDLLEMLTTKPLEVKNVARDTNAK
jgi:hypothetical protein